MPGRPIGLRDAVPEGTAVPGPLADLVMRIRSALAGLAEGGRRSDLHTVRNHLSEICALTEHDPRILRAIDRLVSAADRLAEAALGAETARGDVRRHLSGAQRAADNLDLSLVGARASKIALAVKRGWSPALRGADPGGTENADVGRARQRT